MTTNPTPSTHTLHPTHRDEFHRSGLSDATIAAAGLYSIDREDDARSVLAWSAPGGFWGPGWVCPYPMADDFLDPATRQGWMSVKRQRYVRVKLDHPRFEDRDGESRPIKYESPKNRKTQAYFPVDVLKRLEDVGCDDAGNIYADTATDATDSNSTTTIIITEGEKKALALWQIGLLVIGLGGCWNWTPKAKRDDNGHRLDETYKLLDELERVRWHGRNVIILFDSDAAIKPTIRRAEWELSKVLTARGATVRVARLPAISDDPTVKTGVDDFLIHHGMTWDSGDGGGAAGRLAVQCVIDAAESPTDPTDGASEGGNGNGNGAGNGTGNSKGKSKGKKPKRVIDHNAPRLSKLCSDLLTSMQPKWHRKGKSIYLQRISREVDVIGLWRLVDDGILEAAIHTREVQEAGGKIRNASAMMKDWMQMAASAAIRKLPEYDKTDKDDTLQTDNLLASVQAWLLKPRSHRTPEGSPANCSYDTWARGIEPDGKWLRCYDSTVYAKLDTPGGSPHIATVESVLKAELKYESIQKMYADLRQSELGERLRIRCDGMQVRVWSFGSGLLETIATRDDGGGAVEGGRGGVTKQEPEQEPDV